METSSSHPPETSWEPFHGTVRGVLRRVVLSIVAPVGWLSVTLLYFAFWARNLTLLQEVVVSVVSALTLLGFLAAVWVAFGLRLAGRWVDG